jgi:lipopolysaccharide/colanic/teichoic acid biosynthesis glycosyltransferase/acetyltransferase-like isoleucine patch superfamily enzyme
MKRSFDILIAAIALIALCPLTAILALLVRYKHGSPVLFRQKRPGRNGIAFEMLKLRTMTDGRDENGHPLPDSRRLTPFGKLLRAMSLDEFPELWNVLKGDMSLVGPRPLLMEYLPLYSEAQARRHDVRPGITGWAQVNGRNTISWEEKFELDVWYVDHHNFRLDLKILWLTVWKVFSRDGISAEGKATMPKFTGSEHQSERIKIMSDRFDNWTPPVIEHGKLTEYNWLVQNPEGLSLGRHTDIGAFTYINAKHGVTIEDEVQIGSHCSIYSLSTIDGKAAPVVLKKNCRVGSHSTVMPRTTIGENTVIGAHSFVNCDIPANCVAYGIPAKVVRHLKRNSQQ